MRWTTNPTGGKSDERQQEAVANEKYQDLKKSGAASCDVLYAFYMAICYLAYHYCMLYQNRWGWSLRGRLLGRLQPTAGPLKGEEGCDISSQREIQLVDLLWDLPEDRAGQVEEEEYSKQPIVRVYLKSRYSQNWGGQRKDTFPGDPQGSLESLLQHW